MRPYEIGLYEKAMPELSWPEKLAAAKEAGYDFVEISIDASEEKISRVYMDRAEKAHITSEIPLWVHTDGEVDCRSSDITLRILPDKLQLIV